MNHGPIYGPGPVLPPTHQSATELDDPEYQHDPKVVFRRLRTTHGSVAPVLLSGVPAWLVVGHGELQNVTSDPETFARNSARWRLGPLVPPDWPHWPMVGGGQAGDSILYTEGETHRRRADALNTALNQVDPVEFRARCEEFSEQLLVRFSSEGQAELMSRFALQLPLMAMGWALGISGDSEKLINGFMTMLSGGPDAAAGMQVARDVITGLVHEVRNGSAVNVASRLAADPAGLTDSQLIEDLIVTLIAGHQTLANWIGNALRLMLTDARFTDTFSRGRLSVSQALREVLWDDTPTQVFAGRWTARPARLGQYVIPEGDLVLLGLAAANNDPHIRPDSGAPLHGSRAYLSYSHGEHGCPVAARDMSEAIACAGIEVLLGRLPSMTLDCRPEELTWLPGIWMRGLKHLPVRFTPALPTHPYLGSTLWT